MARRQPRQAPWREIAVLAYSEHVGKYLQRRPSRAESVVIMIGRKRFRQALKMASTLESVATLADVPAAAARYPALRFTLFDLPAVTEIASETFEKHGISGRTQITSGSFLKDPLPLGADVASLIRVLHDHDDDSALVILTGIRKALPPQGRLVLAEPLSGAPDTAPIADAYFGLYFAAMGQGKTRTSTEIAHLGRMAGFTRISTPRSRMPLITSVMVLEH